MEMLDKRLNDKGKNWRHVFKVLTSSLSDKTINIHRRVYTELDRLGLLPSSRIRKRCDLLS